jgi:integrase
VKLTANWVRAVRVPGKYRDDESRGLFLHVIAPTRRYWMFRFQLQGRERTMALGNADRVLLSEARRRCRVARTQLDGGIDPLAARQRPVAPLQRPDFAAVAKHYVDAHAASWRGQTAVTRWHRSLAIHALPTLGRMPVDSITTEHVLTVLSPIWTTMSVTAAKVRTRIELVLSFAKAKGWRTGPNPATWRDNLQPLLPAHGRVHRVVHRRSIPWREAPQLMAALREQDSVQACCLAMLLLTATRSAEVRGMRWDEVDREQALWVIGGERTKSGRTHRVPLPNLALAILDRLDAVRSGDLVFPGHVRGRPLADNTLTRLLNRLGFKCVPHGLRSTFRDWCSDTGKPDAAAELALAHAPASKVVAAYARSDLLDARRGLMSAWAGFLATPEVVVAFPAVQAA